MIDVEMTVCWICTAPGGAGDGGGMSSLTAFAGGEGGGPSDDDSSLLAKMPRPMPSQMPLMTTASATIAPITRNFRFFWPPSRRIFPLLPRTAEKCGCCPPYLDAAAEGFEYLSESNPSTESGATKPRGWGGDAGGVDAGKDSARAISTAGAGSGGGGGGGGGGDELEPSKSQKFHFGGATCTLATFVSFAMRVVVVREQVCRHETS